jgi:hypothetical protein
MLSPETIRGAFRGWTGGTIPPSPCNSNPSPGQLRPRSDRLKHLPGSVACGMICVRSLDRNQAPWVWAIEPEVAPLAIPCCWSFFKVSNRRSLLSP